MSGLRGGPLQGVRVVELTKVWAGPYVGKLLAQLGAEVIRIESRGSLDVTRTYGVKDIDDAPGFQAVNAQKLSVQIDMKTEQGIRLILDLLAKSDIVVENLRPGAVKRLGLGYEAVKAVNPRIVFVSMGMYGNTGPLSYQTGYAPCFAALGGLSQMVGPEDAAAPTGMNVRYADSTFGAYAAYAAVVALAHQRRTGEGQFVDVSAVESMTSMIGDAVMDHALTGHVPRWDGNRHADMAPHGAYPCREGGWVSIAVASEGAFGALGRVIGRPELVQHPRFRSRADRQAHAAELDALISAWTVTQDADAATATLQQAGVAAAKSQNSVELVADATLWSRGFFQEVADRHGRTKSTTGPAWTMSRPARVTQAAPRIGEHNAYVLGEVLGLSDDEQRRLSESKITW